MGTFADKIVSGFSKIISFLGKLFGGLFDLIAKAFNSLIHMFAKPLGYLLSFLEGIFYFFAQLFAVAVAIIKIFVAIFQFIGALIMGVFRTIKAWLTVHPVENTNFPSASHEGFKTVVDLLQPTGIMTVVPMVALAFLWFFFALKILGLFGGSIYIKPFGGGGDK